MKRCSKKTCCKQCKQVKFKGTTTKWPVQKQTLKTAQNTQANPMLQTSRIRRCSHVYAHVIRFRHPHGVFTCVRVLHPSNMLNIEFLFCLSVVLYHCFYGKLLKCVKCRCYVCKSCLSLC